MKPIAERKSFSKGKILQNSQLNQRFMEKIQPYVESPPSRACRRDSTNSTLDLQSTLNVQDSFERKNRISFIKNKLRKSSEKAINRGKEEEKGESPSSKKVKNKN